MNQLSNEWKNQNSGTPQIEMRGPNQTYTHKHVTRDRLIDIE